MRLKIIFLFVHLHKKENLKKKKTKNNYKNDVKKNSFYEKYLFEHLDNGTTQLALLLLHRYLRLYDHTKTHGFSLSLSRSNQQS